MTAHTDVIAAEPADSPDTREFLTAYVAELVDLGVVLNTTGSGGVTTADFEPPRGRWLVVRRDQRAVACGGIRLLQSHAGEDAIAEVKRMYVAPQARRGGVARRLLAALEDAARELGAQRVRLDTGADMDSAVALYRSSGYAVIEDYNGNEDAGWWFEKRLT